MSDPTITVVVLEPGKPAEPRDIVPSLENMQAVVGGYLETIGPPLGGRVVIFVNEEGRITGAHRACAMHPTHGVLVGPVLAVAIDDQGDSDDLEPQAVDLVVHILNAWRSRL